MCIRDRLEIVQGVVHLIKNRWLELVQFVGAPPETDLLFKLKTDARGFEWTAVGCRLELLQKTGDPALFVPHRVTHDLRGMGREDEADVEFLQECFQLRGRHVQTTQALKQFTEGCRFGLGGQWWCERIDLLGELL